MTQKIWYTYDDIHRVIKGLAEKIQNSGVKYDAMIAIGGGGFIPARMLRCFLEIPIYAVTTAYYDSDNQGQVTEEVKKVQWFDPLPEALKGKNVLVVDEVDDSRVTMEFCLTELQKEDFNTIGVAVLHEKIKTKVGKLPENIPYFSGITVEDWWINYPWDALDIDEHNQLAVQNRG
ncbi:phosphoribosyltransferase [Neisseria weixii]|uniref:Phosphoribosyltransferase n=1 Tax=Neisseria weixii TaxID=1853276 RepID=A0A3N4MYC2_9NEIS|nr:phosphoribosyltransferase [Neisseria weixii]RPD86807.1 phosphoribosyltransferase [Neisseria weixii]RPD87502.1 phosphoribosyltransferase [Neisseria weixii]